MNPVPCIARAAVLATFLCFASIPLTWATNVEGQLDPHFSGEEFDYGNAVAVQSDGRILVAGTLTDNFGTHHLGLIRLLPDGSLDTSLDDNGDTDMAAARLLVGDETFHDGCDPAFRTARRHADGPSRHQSAFMQDKTQARGADQSPCPLS